MKPVRILYIITLSEIGGAQKVVYHLAAGLEPGLFDIAVACAPGGELVGWLRGLPETIEVFELPELKRDISPLDDFKALWKLYSIIRKGNFDIVHCHSSKAGILGRLAARLAGVPAIYFTAHGWGLHAYQNWVARLFFIWAERLAGTVSTKVICVSEADLIKGKALKLAPAEKFTLIHNGLPEPDQNDGLLRGEFGFSKEDMVIGTVARLAPQKDPIFLLQVAERILSRQNSYAGQRQPFFVMIGDGPLRSSCKAYLTAKGIDKSVFLLGSREEAACLMRDFDVFVLFSRWEGLPLTIIEAMLGGCPVAATKVGGVSELVEDGKTGLLIDESDLAAAEAALMDLIANPPRRRAMGKAGRERALRLFSIDKMIQKYRDLYLERLPGCRQ
ncbi:putative glycosyltransferase EpsD [Pelotomaculum schinkii]|uniref:Putative glycosyltransferase EpsD n=1 Tax=Pelotomaculum schinkii TaxID=78350 RepID=A0A4Y7R795_9FIRM|nr:glycosyltransferase family 4 protein [Pelotomaculum schinkii]TEB04623.1 putative glycosyltransferase EpsD [Pelotomaculum schinkii]